LENTFPLLDVFNFSSFDKLAFQLGPRWLKR
jgi:hypothetical protein